MFSPTRRLVFPHSYGPSSVPRNRLWTCSASGITICLHRHLLEIRNSYHRSFMDHHGSFRRARWYLVALCQVTSILDGPWKPNTPGDSSRATRQETALRGLAVSHFFLHSSDGRRSETAVISQCAGRVKVRSRAWDIAECLPLSAGPITFYHLLQFVMSFE